MPGNLYDHQDLLKLPLPLGFLPLDQALSTSGLIENAMAMNRQDRPKRYPSNVAYNVPQFPSLGPALFRKCRHIQSEDRGNEAEASENNRSDCENHNGMTLTCA